MLYLIAQWLDANYEKIWLIVSLICIILVIFGTVSHSEIIYDAGDTLTDFYDECLSE